MPSILPSVNPSTSPSLTPSHLPSLHPSTIPTTVPSVLPSVEPSMSSLAPSRDFDFTKLLAPDAAAGDRFGHSVSVSGEIIVVGAPFDDDAGTDSGSAHIFDTSGHHLMKLTVPTNNGTDTMNDLYFGRNVAVSDTNVVVGAEGDQDERGSIYIFNTSGDFVNKVFATDGIAGDHFGDSLSVSGSTIVVGAPKSDDMGDRSGSAYIFDIVGGFERKLIAPDGEAGDNFGCSIDVSGTTVVVGAYLDNDMGDSSGSVYIFDVSGDFVEKLLAPDGEANDEFGYSVSVFGTTIVVGSPLDDDNGPRSGSAYIFDTLGVFQKKLVAPDGEAGDNFGISVSVSETSIVVGAYLDAENDIVSGTAYVFRISGQFETKLVPLDGADLDNFGYSLSISGSTIVVGAWLDDDEGSLSGSVYIAK